MGFGISEYYGPTFDDSNQKKDLPWQRHSETVAKAAAAGKLAHSLG